MYLSEEAVLDQITRPGLRKENSCLVKLPNFFKSTAGSYMFWWQFLVKILLHKLWLINGAFKTASFFVDIPVHLKPRQILLLFLQHLIKLKKYYICRKLATDYLFVLTSDCQKSNLEQMTKIKNTAANCGTLNLKEEKRIYVVSFSCIYFWLIGWKLGFVRFVKEFEPKKWDFMFWRNNCELAF